MAFGFDTTGDEIAETFKDQVKGKTFLITGPTPGGIGAETALSLSKGNPQHLILAGRSHQKIQPLIDQIQQLNPNVKTTFIGLDLSSQASIRKAAEDVKSLLSNEKIDVLILNAAVMACPYALTVDGVESQFGTNALGHFLFSNLLLKADLIRSRVVVVSSSAAERSVGYVFQPLQDPTLTYNNGTTYDAILSYSFSKTCNILYARKLANSPTLKAKNITAFSLNPGSIATNLQGYLTPEMRAHAIEAVVKDNPDFVLPQQKTIQQGCSTQLRAALDPSLAADSGKYFDDCQAKNVRLQDEAYFSHTDQVWELCEKLVGEKFEF